MTVLLAGFGLGLAGSLHCVAMCGPLLSVMAPVLGRRLSPALWYHGGRLLSYAAIGVVAGFAGAAAGAAGVGRGLSVVAGLTLLLMAFGQATQTRGRTGVWVSRRLAGVLGLVAKAREGHPEMSALGAGAVNGLLPCGLVYAAALAASTAGAVAGSASTMLAFGAGTLPAMLGVWASASLIPAGLRRRLRVITPAVVAVVGLLLILRGLPASVQHLDAREATTESQAATTLHSH